MPLIRVPFADSGDKTSVPVAAQSDGSVSYVQGYPLAYSLDPETDTGAKRIERLKMNQLFNDITVAIREMQTVGIKPFITSDENGGTAFAYGIGAMVSYNGAVYQSLVANNTQLPTVTANWSQVSNQVNSVSIIGGTFAGDLNTITVQGVYSLTAAASNAPLPQTALLEHFERAGSARVQIWHSCTATVTAANRHYIRTGTVSAGVTTWTPWTQTTLRPVELTGSVEANSLTESGVYYAASWSNTPVSAAAFMDVTSTGSGGAIVQFFHTVSNNVRYYRSYSGGAWSAWKQLVTYDVNGGRLLNMQVFNDSGTYNATNNTGYVIVEAVGGGGAGGGAPATQSGAVGVGSGGTAGSYGKGRYSANFNGVQVTVGAGGLGVLSESGNPGGDSSFGTLLVARGGSGGIRKGPSAPTFGITGSPIGGGTSGANIVSAVGAPGGYSLAASLTAFFGGIGAPSHFGGGGTLNTVNANGIDGTAPGSGGSGAFNSESQSSARRGGNGSKGLVIVWEYS